jgi:hypothetical protein
MCDYCKKNNMIYYIDESYKLCRDCFEGLQERWLEENDAYTLEIGRTHNITAESKSV